MSILFNKTEKEMKDWMREEIFWSKQVYLFNLLSKEKGKDFAFNYQKIFETTWQDRANHAGWNLEISYKKEECIFHFMKEQ